ncbi:MAG: serine--tRNA ligase [Parcubacteria group bacterium]|nr:serine--tRNA ligase [Parcubacteria group bacterium]
MLDIKFIRENPDKVKEGCEKKQVKVDIDRLLEVDKERRELLQKIEGLKAEQNKISGKGKADKAQIDRAKEIKNKIKDIQPALDKVEKECNQLLYKVPNITDPEMPIGKSEDENVEIKKWGEIPKFDFKVKNHMELGVKLDIIDTEKAAEVSGSRFFYLKNEAVLLQFAIIQFVFETLTNKKIIKKIVGELGLKISTKAFSAMLPPVMIRDSVQKSIHRVFGDETYRFEDEKLNLVASAEHTMAPYHMNEVIDQKKLPLRYIGYSTAFRREAGTYGKDMSGILRTHQFDKLEMESFTDIETGKDEQKLIVGLQEYLVQQLELPYRLVHICTGDTGGPDYNQFDIECWIPSQNKYRETHTSDYMTDYQTRGIKSFYKDKDGNRRLLHTNDATAFALGRTLVAIIENYQQKDGSIKVPKVLQKYMGGMKEIN